MIVPSPAYVIPVTLALFQRGSGEAKGSLPSAGLGGILGERKLAGIIVP